jgi:iron-sulfur cluster repair protein YtfE (RIC family)
VAQPTNAVDLLLRQHEQIIALFKKVTDAKTDAGRQHAFDELRELIAVHETAEEVIVRPVTRKQVPGGDDIADARMAEENEGKEALAELEKITASSPAFVERFAAFRADVEEHAKHEEELEFPALRDKLDADTLATMGKRIQQAEAAAPTHAHPSAKTTAANVVLGPFAAIADRIRDAIAS